VNNEMAKRQDVTVEQTSQGLWDPTGLELPKDPAWVGVARLAAAGIAYRAGLSYEAIEDIKVIVAEAMSYCIQYGGAVGRLRISFESGVDHLIVTVRDPGFPVVESLPKDHDGSGYRIFVDGLFLIRGLANDVEYTADTRDGLTLRIRRDIG
jgi:serine/threonine-protein kinase RsbW